MEFHIDRWTAFFLVLFLSALLPPLALAQRTVERDAGGGMKLQLVYDAAGRLAATRTLNSARLLLSQTRYEYRPGYPAPQLTTTSYWSDGKSVRSVSENNYDANGNFTAEKVANFDESGKQITGHVLLHDPATNLYRCSTWNAARQKYAPSECPATEGSGESGGESKPLTRAEALHDLETSAATRRGTRAESQNRPLPKDGQFALVLPSPLKPGELVSGTVIEDAARFLARPGLTVVPFALPASARPGPEALSDFMLEPPGEPPRPANGPVTFTVPAAAPRFHIVLRAVDDPSRTATLTLHASLLPPLPRRKSGRFAVSPLCLRGDLCPVSGPFHGDASQTAAAIDALPADIVAESLEKAYVRIPPSAPPGPCHFLVSDGGSIVALPVVVAELEFSLAHGDLERGQTATVEAVLSGPETLPDDRWHPLPHVSKTGAIRLILHNATPATASLRGSSNQTLSFDLNPKSFEAGEFKYSFIVIGLKTAPFSLWGDIVPLLAPVASAPFPAP